MSEEQEVDAVLKRAVIVKGTVVGQVYGDRKRRFEDGDYVRTSKIVHRDGDVIKTLNSTYRCEFATPVELG